MTNVNSPFKIKNHDIQNRIIFQPIEGCDAENDGAPSLVTFRKYTKSASGGAGIYWIESVAISQDSRSNFRQLYINEKNVDLFKQLIKKIKQTTFNDFGFYPKVIMQLHHSGRQLTDYQNFSPIIVDAKLPSQKGELFGKSLEIDNNKCKEIISDFIKASKLAIMAGADGIDIKCCHGYLLNEFLVARNREDEFGGCFENRIRMILEILKSIKKELGKEFIYCSRLSVFDGFKYPYGFGSCENNVNEYDLTEPKNLIAKLIENGIDLINITIGHPFLLPHINTPYRDSKENGRCGIERFAKITADIQHTFKNLPIVLSAPTFMFEKSLDYANLMLKNNNCSFIGFGRMTLAYPEFYKHFMEIGKLNINSCCHTCGKCIELMMAGEVVGCSNFDSLYADIYNRVNYNKKNKKNNLNNINVES